MLDFPSPRGNNPDFPMLDIRPPTYEVWSRGPEGYKEEDEEDKEEKEEDEEEQEDEYSRLIRTKGRFNERERYP